MIVGIDASNVRGGGGFTYLSRLVAAVHPEDHGIREIRIWANHSTAKNLPDRPGVTVIHEPLLDRKLWWRLFWQRVRLPVLSRSCDLLFVPGGNNLARFSPIVSMSRNMLCFELKEMFRYRVSITTLRLLLLRFGQSRTFRASNGLIFLTSYARDTIVSAVGPIGAHMIIPHGVDERFRALPRPQRPLGVYGLTNPIRLVYVSILDRYKHQWNVAEAVASLRLKGMPVEIDFIGPHVPAALRRLRRVIRRLDPDQVFLHYRGPVPYDQLHELRNRADVFVFASSCENMPNILLEAMASGFPIACSGRGPMPEILGDCGVYFDPERPADIETALQKLAGDAALRERCAVGAYERAQNYSWERCARETFDFITAVARES